MSKPSPKMNISSATESGVAKTVQPWAPRPAAQGIRIVVLLV